MALDHRYPFAAQALPTPNDTPYETPSRGISSSWQGSSSPYSNSSPAPFPPSEESYFPRQHAAGDDGDDKRYSTHDPRRLTPNLGISFVSQIHSLKKELESKDTLVESLEESLHQAKAETDQLSDELDDKKVEVKSLKHQMQSLEHDMLQALEDMANQRDNAVESVADTRKRLEASKKKTRAQEEDAIRTQELWETDKQTWEDKKQKLESKVYVVEERLKTMVAEMLAVQSIGENRLGVLHDVDEGMRDTWMVKGTDTWNNRTTSGQSNRSLGDVYEGKESANFRTSRLSGLHAQGGSNMSDLSLAEELKLDEDEEEDAEGDLEDHSMFSPNALPEEYEVANRYSEDEKARKIMGFHSDKKGERLRDESSRQCSTDIIDDYYNFSRRHSAVSYTDTATQFTPPTSPILQAQQMDFISERPVEQTERAANQSRKRVAIPQIFVEQTSAARHETAKPSRMISVGCQTVEQPQQPPIIAEAISPSASAMEAMKFASTQTSEDALPVSKPADSRLAPLPLDVPVIAIHPPASRPPSSHNSVVLPPRTKNAACQVVIEMPRSLRSMAVQTEEIRIDKRPIRIPPRLQPSVFSPSILVRSVERWTQTSQTPQESAPAPPIRKVRSPTPTLKDQIIRRPNSLKSRDAYREHNDNGPLDSKQRSGPRRPIRTESIFAGFDDVNCIENDGIQTDLSDDDFATAAPIRKTLSKVQNSWKLVPQSKVSVSERLESASEETGDQKGNDAHEIPEAKAKAAPKSTSKSFQTKPSKGSRRTLKNSQEADIRRKALTANGIAEHTQRTRSPSAPDLPGKKSSMVAPPFPVPTRASSRKIPISASDGAGSPTPYTTSFFTARRGQEPSKPPAKRRILRKTQSAATVVKEPTRRPPPPPPISASSTIPASPKPSLPSRNQFVLPYDSVAELPKQLSTVARPEPHAGSATIESPGQQTSVVDAIAQTMVGEWMWKYVRKRTSFGITENPQVEFEMGRNGEAGSSSGARHKRWVWLAPYENAVIWSSKQPTSGPALLGKGGRKRTYYEDSCLSPC